MIKIVVDAFGGDNSPIEIVKGVVSAINEIDDLHIVLAGDEKILNNLLREYQYNSEQLSILNAPDIITNNESATEAVRTKKDSSIVKGVVETKDNDDIAGFISCGSTGAVLTAGFLKLGRIKGVLRPALCPILPTVKGGSVLLCDAGANMDTKPEYLEQFAIMASAYAEVMGIKKPRVALLNVGTEDHKGDARSKETFELLSNNKCINFVGNMEARDLLTGDYDVVVADGFSGNVLLKSTEGSMKTLLGVLKSEIKSSFWSKIGALFMKKTFKSIKKTFDYSKYGGAVLLGCKKIIVKGHGSSKSNNIIACIKQVYSMQEGKLIEKISKTLEKSGIVENEK
jgi:glycerol-3-phosphate acyltransferase PlsX